MDRTSGGESVSDPGTIWDERYRAQSWSTVPDPELVRLVDGLPAGRAVDLGCGPGRNACWLALRGWTVTGVDASQVGLEQAQARAGELGVALELVHADVRTFDAPAESVDLVVMANLHPLPEEQQPLLARAARWLRPGGHLFVTGHHRDSAGRHGPPDPRRLYSVEELSAALPPGLAVEELAKLERLGADLDPGAQDTVVVLFARRSAGSEPE